MIFAALKDHLVPHEGNGHRPRFLRAETMRIVAGFALMLEVLVFVLPTASFVSLVGGQLASVLPTVLGALTNDERASLSLPPLKESTLLDRAAQLKAEDMAANGYFAHTSPAGKTPWHWLELVGYAYDYAGENLAVNFSDSADVTAAWMNSPTHRANIVKAQYTEIGTGIATGTYEGKETVFVAQVFGRPRAAAPVQATSATAATAVAPAETATPAPAAPAAPQPAQVRPRAATNPVTAAKAVPPPAETATPQAEEPRQPAADRAVATVAGAGATFAERAAASPRRATAAVLGTLLAAIVGAVAINLIANRYRLRHFDLVTNGVTVAALVGALILANGYWAGSGVRVSSTDYAASAIGTLR